MISAEYAITKDSDKHSHSAIVYLIRVFSIGHAYVRLALRQLAEAFIRLENQKDLVGELQQRHGSKLGNIGLQPDPSGIWRMQCGLTDYDGKAPVAE